MPELAGSSKRGLAQSLAEHNLPDRRAASGLTWAASPPRWAPRIFPQKHRSYRQAFQAMKIRNSLKSLKSRHRDCRVIRRRGRTYVINKTNRRFKARQG